MSVNIYNNTKIYIACPANTATGGPELLHQLAHHFINDLEVQTFMYYYNFDVNKYKTPVHPEYEFYNVPYVLEIPLEEDIERNILIVPEVLSGLSLLSKYKNIRKGVWFLSVDNYYFSRITKKDFFFERAVNKLMKLFNKPLLFDIFSDRNLNKLFKKYLFSQKAVNKVVEKLLKQKFDLRKFKMVLNSDFHLVQSFYAKEHLEKAGISKEKILYLSDYLNLDFLNIQTDLSKKENIVLYNPVKGFKFTKKIIQSAPDIRFVPLINMTRQQMIETLQKAKVYIDFGNHPGKDRIPRETAILVCCIITGKRGSAAYFEDVSIPEKYKFEDKEENIQKIIAKIKDCFENFEERYKDFEYYRQIIKQEPQKFIEDLKKIFLKVEK